jgi:type IV pilus assembly protein PilM
MPKIRSILGIDLRVTSVKVVEIEASKGRPLIANWGTTEIPYTLVDKHPEREDAQAEALRRLVQIRKIKTKEAAVVVGGEDVFVKIYSLSEVSKAEATEAIKWKLAEELPFPIEEAIFDFYPLVDEKSSEGKKNYLAACMNQKIYRDIVYVLSKAGLKLAAITIMPDVLSKVFESEVLPEEDKVISLIYMGKRTTNISILKANRLLFNRELNIGGENITLAMSGVMVSTEGRVEVSPEEAEKIKVEHGVPIDATEYPKVANIPISQLQAMVRPALERVLDEIMRTFEYFKGQTGEAEIEKIILTGGSSRTVNLVKFLSEGLGIRVLTPSPVREGDYEENLLEKAALEQLSPRLSAAIGAALVADKRINLIPDEVKHRWEIMAKKVLKPQYMALAFAGLLCLIYGMAWIQTMILENVISSTEMKLKEYRPRIKTLGVIEQTAKEQEKRKIALRLHEEGRTKIPDVFKEMSGIVPKGVIIRSMALAAKSLRVKGTAFAVGDTAENILSQFVLSLSGSEYFINVKLIEAVKNDNYVQKAFDFEITANIKI